MVSASLFQRFIELPAIQTRRVLDAWGVEWRVLEVAARYVPGSRGDFCLIFDAPGVCHRLWEYPADWSSLSDAELLALGRRHRDARPLSAPDSSHGEVNADAAGDIRAA
jgi:hypothetical protein